MTLEDRIAEISEFIAAASEICSEVTTDSLDHDNKAQVVAADMLSDLECAETVETEADFHANLDSALLRAADLIKLLPLGGESPRGDVRRLMASIRSLRDGEV